MSVVTKESNPELYNALFPEDEIKEILDNIKSKYEDYYVQDIVSGNDLKILLDYITNLQEENEELREDNFAYHQLMKMQNQREYRSKFLKDFQKEHGKNVFPDYDEIYKRYDIYKTRNEKAIEKCINKQYETNAPWLIKFAKDVENILQGSDE